MDQENIIRPYGQQEFQLRKSRQEQPLLLWSEDSGTLTLRADVRDALRAIVRDMVREEMQATQARE